MKLYCAVFQGFITNPFENIRISTIFYHSRIYQSISLPIYQFFFSTNPTYESIDLVCIYISNKPYIHLTIEGWDEPGPPDAGLYADHHVPVHVDLKHRHHGYDAPHRRRRRRGYQRGYHCGHYYNHYNINLL